MLLYLGRSTSFYFDEWDWIQGRRAWDLDALLLPHNEHLSLAPVLVFKALFSTVGIDSYVPYRVAGLALHCGVVVLLFAYARRRVGDAARARRGGDRAVPRHRLAGRPVAVPDRLPRLARGGHRGAAGARPRGSPRRRDGGGAAGGRAGVVLARDPAAARRRARGARAPRPARALVGRRRARRALRRLVRRLRRRAGRPRATTCSARPATSPRRPRARPARCSRSGATGAARSRSGWSWRCC